MVVSGVWQTTIGMDYKHIHLGYFDDETDAARTRNITANALFGNFASLNEVKNPLAAPKKRAVWGK